MPQILLLIHPLAQKAAAIRASLIRSLEPRYLVEWNPSGAGALQRLLSVKLSPVAGVLLSLDLADSQDFSVFDAILEVAGGTPILILSSVAQEFAAKHAVQRGAQDYVLDSEVDNRSLLKAVRTMLERTANAEALFTARERAAVTLNSIGDAVISTDSESRVTFLNPVAQTLTGWTASEAIGRPINEVLHIVDGSSDYNVLSPTVRAIKDNRTAKLATGCKLIRRDDTELSIEDSAAPIHDRTGRVTGAVMVFHDVTQTQALTNQMAHLAQHDYLTDLPNRLLLNDRLSQAVAAARRRKHRMAVLFLDLDRFKHVNDSLGHGVGDQLLVSIAARLVACVRGSDTVSRQGGDEFVVLLSAIAHPEDAALSAQKIIANVGMPHQIDQHNLQVTLSVGISIYPDDGGDAETLLRNADIAMLHAKDDGRNNFQFFKPRMNERALERQSIESGLRHALERDEFILHYQAKIDLVTEALTGAEALIRWKPPRRELVYPADFISIAEQCGYIVAIGRWLLRKACEQIHIWRDAHLAPIPIAVNISAVELRSKNFVEHVRRILMETATEASCLEFEITETALMQDAQSAIKVLKDLRDMGIRLTLDDFGTGYSSLSYLKRFPIDALKIDQSFVQGLCKNAEDSKLVSAVIDLGRSFHLRVIAEGVETRAQFLALQHRNCEEGQGYYFRRPMGANEFARLIGTDLSATDMAF